MTRRNILLRKCMTIMLSLALVFTMMPMVPGTVEKVYAEAGSAITITDSTGTQIVIDTTGEGDVSNYTGTGYAYDLESNTLTLEEFNGKQILSNGDFNLHLKGENTITMTDEMAIDGEIYGLKATTSDGNYCRVTVTADEGGTLNITGEDLTTSTYAWYALTDFTNGTVNIDASITSGILYGIYGGMTFTENGTNSATLNVNVVNEGDNAAIGLGNGGILIENRDNVDIDVVAKADYQATALSILQIIDAAPVITAKATKLDGTTIGAKQRAVSEPIYYMQLTEGGKVTLDGMIVIYEGRISWNENTIVTTPANSAYYWAPAKAIDQYATNDYVYMKNLDETPVTKAIFEYSEDPTRTLQYNGAGIASIPGGKVGTAIDAVYLHRYISGELDSRASGDSYMVYEITGGSLPEGLALGRNNGRIYGTPTAKAEAGTIEVTATDGRGTYSDTTDDQVITFTVPYGAIASAKPVTAVTLSEEELIINKGETVEFTATVTPTDAPYAEVSVTRENFNITGIDSIGNPVDGVTTIGIEGGTTVGKDVLTVTSKDTGVKKTINVYVKEEKPNAGQDKTHITGLLSDTEYTINGEEYVSDGSGKITIDPSWRKTTVSIVRTNDEPKCNSDAQELEIAAQPLYEEWVTLAYDSVVYDDTEKTPAVTVNDGTKDLVKDTDYTVAYADNTNIGTATVTVKGINDYSGTIIKTFEINGINIRNATVTLSKNEYDYNGNAHEPDATVVLAGDTLIEGTDYTVSYSKNINAGTGFVTVTGKGIYEGGISVVFNIHAASIEGMTPTLAYDKVTYDGTVKEPRVTFDELTTDDYTVSYSNNTNAGTATVTIEGKENYKGTITKNFTIEKADVNDVTVTLDHDIFAYTGASQGPNITVKDGEKTLAADTDYTITGDSKGTAAGTYAFTIEGKGNYEGSIEKTFTINPCTHDWDEGTVTKNPTCTETGTKVWNCEVPGCGTTKSETIPVDKDAHPAGSIKDIPAKEATCKESGLTAGKQCTACGTVTVAQTEVPKLTTHTYGSDNKCTVCGEEKPGTGGETTPDPGTTPGTGGSTGDSSGGGDVVTPAPTPTPEPGTGTGTETPDVPDVHQHKYVKTVTKATAKKDGSIVVKCSCGKVKSKTVIKKASKIKLSKSSYAYTGKVIKAKNLPKVIVKDSAGKTIAAKYYTVTKPKNVKKMKAIGRYAYKITFKKTCKEYTGFKTVYLQIIPNKTSISSVKPAKKAVTVKWKKGKKAQVTGYQVMLATNKKFTKSAKTVTLKGYSKASKKVSKLKAKTKYFVKVRTYKTVKGVKIYSDWSKVKTVKTK